MNLHFNNWLLIIRLINTFSNWIYYYEVTNTFLVISKTNLVFYVGMAFSNFF